MKFNPKYDRVILRRWNTGPFRDVIAVFPDECGTNEPYTCSSYQHVGQHASCDYDHVRRVSVPVKIKYNQVPQDADVRALLNELRSIGYKPRLVQTMPRDSLARRRAIFSEAALNQAVAELSAMQKDRGEVLKKPASVPYPEFCHHPAKCAGLGSCPRDPCCCE